MLGYGPPKSFQPILGEPRLKAPSFTGDASDVLVGVAAVWLEHKRKVPKRRGVLLGLG